MSTALMYSFRERADTTVVDEPLYAHYLRVTGREHPDRDAVLASQHAHGGRVVEEVILGDYATPVVFFKQMGHHLVELDLTFLGRCRNVLLTRHPHDMLSSLTRVLPDATLADTGLPQQAELLDEILAAGEAPIVIDSRRLLADPGAVLTVLCERLGLAFEPAMLSWPAGPKPEDGVWAPHWYHNVHRSTGFDAHRPAPASLPAEMEPVLADALPLYMRLSAYAIGES